MNNKKHWVFFESFFYSFGILLNTPSLVMLLLISFIIYINCWASPYTSFGVLLHPRARTRSENWTPWLGLCTIPSAQIGAWTRARNYLTHGSTTKGGPNFLRLDVLIHPWPRSRSVPPDVGGELWTGIMRLLIKNCLLTPAWARLFFYCTGLRLKSALLASQARWILCSGGRNERGDFKRLIAGAVWDHTCITSVNFKCGKCT